MSPFRWYIWNGLAWHLWFLEGVRRYIRYSLIFFMENKMRKLILAGSAAFLLLLVGAAQAQEFDVGFGVNTMLAPSASSASNGYASQSLNGGAYPVVGAYGLFKKHFGVGGEIAWKASQGLYQGYQPYRPLFFDFNGVYVRPVGKHLSAELMAGIGAETIRFYQQYYTCSFVSCTNYSSSTHFLGHFGAGVKYYFYGNFFIRPEAHIYLINNNIEFSSPWAARVGASIGYTFRPIQ
jgi:hypothetical protein